MKGKHKTPAPSHRPNLPGTRGIRQPSIRQALANTHSGSLFSLTSPPQHSSSSNERCSSFPALSFPSTTQFAFYHSMSSLHLTVQNEIWSP